MFVVNPVMTEFPGAACVLGHSSAAIWEEKQLRVGKLGGSSAGIQVTSVGKRELLAGVRQNMHLRKSS